MMVNYSQFDTSSQVVNEVFYLDNVVLTIHRETIYVNNKVCVLLRFA